MYSSRSLFELEAFSQGKTIHWLFLDINTVFHHVGLILLNKTKNIAPSISLKVVNVRPVSKTSSTISEFFIGSEINSIFNLWLNATARHNPVSYTHLTLPTIVSV